jgi:hypothetical protein
MQEFCPTAGFDRSWGFLLFKGIKVKPVNEANTSKTCSLKKYRKIKGLRGACSSVLTRERQ